MRYSPFSNVLVSCFLIWYFALGGHAQITGDFRLEYRFPYGPSHGLAVMENIAAFGHGAVIELMDLTHRQSPLPLAKIKVHAAPSDLAIRDHYLFVAMDEQGLAIYDIEDPFNPVQVGSTQLNSYNHQLAVDEGWVYLSDGNGDLSIINLTDVENPSIETILDVSTRAWEMVLHQDVLMVVVFDSLLIFDVSNPTTPVQLNAIYAKATDVEIAGDKLYLCVRNDSLLVFDFTDPTNLIKLGGHLDYGRFVKVQILGEHVYSGGTVGRFSIYHIESNDQFSSISEIKGGGYINNLIVQDSQAFLLNTHQGLSIYDINELASPSLLFHRENESFSLGLEVLDGRLYLANWEDGLNIYDVRDLSEVKFLGGHITGYQTYDVALKDQYAYLIEHSGILRIIDIADPANPNELRNVRLPGETWDIEVQDNLLYVLQRGSGLFVLDIAMAALPVLVDSLIIDGDLQRMDIEGNYAYITNAREGLLIVDISNPDNLFMAGSFTKEHTKDQFINNFKDIEVVGNLGFVADNSNGFHIVDFSDILNPVQLVNTWTPGRAFAVKKRDDVLFITLQHKGIQAFDITDPSNPKLISSLETGGNVEYIAIEGDYIYITDYSSGFSILTLEATTSNTEFNPNVGFDLKMIRNPLSNDSEMIITMDQAMDITLAIYDLHGRGLHVHQGLFAAGINRLPVYGIFNDFSSGIYVLELSAGKKRQYRKVIVP